MGRATGLKNLLNRRANYRSPSPSYRMREPLPKPMSEPEPVPFRPQVSEHDLRRIPIEGRRKTDEWHRYQKLLDGIAERERNEVRARTSSTTSWTQQIWTISFDYIDSTSSITIWPR